MQAVLSTFQILIDAANENWEWLKASMEITREAEKMGFSIFKLEYFTELTKGSVVRWFDLAHVIRAKESLGNTTRIASGISNPWFILRQP